jgi:cytochrome c5
MIKRVLIVVAMALVLPACGKKEAPAQPTAAATPAPAPQVTPQVAQETAQPAGEAVFKKACITCHGAGIAGAPKLGDATEWSPRIAQGVDVLYQHSIGGFTGKKGMMPPKGGFTSLSDDEVKAAVDYMVGQAQ